MNENAIDSENMSKPASDPAKAKGERKPAKKARPAKKASRAKKAAGKPKADRANKKAEVIEMKRAKGATLPEIMKTRAGRRTVRRSGSSCRCCAGYINAMGRLLVRFWRWRLAATEVRRSCRAGLLPNFAY
jgi:hypothetical protein